MESRRVFAGILFSYVGPILPECDEYGKVIGELPQHRFRNEQNLPLSKYGQGPFCRFRVAKGWQQSGVFVLANGDNPLYVGECQNLEDRWGTRGFGGISPRNCYKGGQDTNCRINNLIYEKTRTGENFDLWFHALENAVDRTALKARLVAELNPPWNLTSTALPSPPTSRPREPSPAWVNPVAVSPASPARPTSKKGTAESGRVFAGTLFSYVGPILPKRDCKGVLIEESPKLPSDVQMHRYGKGPFCRFRIAQENRWRRSGVYVLSYRGAAHYVGMCKNLAMIWNFVGRITPSAVRIGGQQTHCRINALILDEAKRGAEAVLWFHALENDAEREMLKAKLVAELNPPWNLTHTAFPSPPTSRPRESSPAWANPVTVSPTSPAGPISKKATAENGRVFAGILFSYVGPILPKCDEYRKVIGELPQHRFRNEQNLPLSKYGQGPFCRFLVAKGWQQSGVYVLANGDDPLYVGECQNLEDRWGTTGFGVSPQNCYWGGQDTNCRINNLIYEKTRTGENLALWFHSIEVDEHARLEAESRLIASLRPPWNR